MTNTETSLSEDFNEIYKAHARNIYNLAFRMTGNPEDAEEITQDTFFNGFNRIDGFKGHSHVYTWLYAIARNKCLRFLQKKKIRNSFIEMEALIDTASHHKTDADIKEWENVNFRNALVSAHRLIKIKFK